jgi:glycosyltransferase involved in cell wall biosynthesis
MKKLNIAILLDPVYHQVGGSFVSTLRFAELLEKRGHKIIFIAAKYPGRPAIDHYKKIKIYRFSSVLVPKTEGQFYISFPTKKKLKIIFKKEKIDILHIMIPTPAVMPSIKAAQELGIKIVAHSHTQPENLFLHLPKAIPNQRINKLFYKYLIWIYRKAEITICPSKFAKRLLKEQDPKLKTMVLSNGVDLSKFKKVNYQKFIEKYHLSDKHLRILFVGRLHPEKSVDTLIKAMPFILKEFKNVHLDIVGKGHLSDNFQELIKRLKIENHVKLFGKLSDEELQMAYNASDIFVLPSLAELEGMVVLEAMACGKPIIIANSENSASTYFVEGNGFLFKPKDSKDLAKKLLIILKDEELRDKMSKQSYKNSREYDINRSVSILENIYYSIKDGRTLPK